ncbi:MAG: alpha/beta hydrolase [Bacteroidota bacterium]
MNRKIFRGVKIVVLVYCVLGIALFYLQNVFLFHPEALPRNYKYKFDVPFEETEIALNKTDTFSLVKFFPVGKTPKGVVLYFHGNRTNINRYAQFMSVFTSRNYEVWMGDYPGFGKSTGERTEENMYAQADQLYRLALSAYGKDSIIFYGKSLGTGVATYLASREQGKQLILETPYYSIPGIFACYAPIYPVSRMIHFKLPSNEYLPDVAAPVTIFHGTDDGVIPYRCAERLKQFLKPGDRFITIEDGSHHDLGNFPQYRQTMDSLLRVP